MKKGNVATDIIFLVIFIFALGIGYFTFHYGFNTAIGQMQNNTQINQSNASYTALESTKATTNRFDYIVLGVFVGFVLALIITGYFIGGYPIFMILYFGFIVVAVVIAAVLSNAWDQFVTTPIFGTTISSLPITAHLINNMPIYVAIAGFIGMVVMFSRPFLQGE